jgi:protein O-GlcNAc transferase
MLQRPKPALLVDLGFCLSANGEPAAAEAVLRQAILAYGFELAIGSPTAKDFTNLARAFFELEDADQALEMVDRALALEPQMESALSHKAMFLAELPDRHDEAMEIWQQLLAINPNNLGLICNRAKLLIDYGEVEEAIELLERLIAQAPHARGIHYQLAFARSISGEAFVQDHLQHLRSYWQEFRHHIGIENASAISFSLPKANDKLRIGILTAELGDHVVSLFLEPFLRNYDRNQLEVELVEVHEHRSARSAVLAKFADAVITVQGLDLDVARQRVRSRGYHLIVETSGFTEHSGIELLATRCAPVQCHYLGFHASTGLDTIDWFIGDELTAAEDLADQYVERLWRLPRLWLASRHESGLPDATSHLRGSKPVLGSFNQFGKVRTETLRFWAAALKMVPDAELHLKNFVTDSERPRDRILQHLDGAGIDPGRVVFLPRTDDRLSHLECYRSIDVALDATPWAGATTTVEALMMGVPVVGILGRTTASRMGCSILSALGREGWIASTPESFAQAVGNLVNDLHALRSARAALRAEVLQSPIFDGPDLACSLQEAFLAMVGEKLVKRSRTDTGFTAIG